MVVGGALPGPATPGQTFATANEIHIPVGEPVLVRLVAADVIHSFWVPGPDRQDRHDPGRDQRRPGCRPIARASTAASARNTAARSTPTWRSFVVADAAGAVRGLAAGAARSRRAGARDAGGRQGEAVFVARCGACHTVRGTTGRRRRRPGPDPPDEPPDAGRRRACPTPSASLIGWIADPQAIKPGAQMPRPDLSGPELNARLRAYLETLR